MSEENATKGKRPGFLTVLCILTFIGSGIGLIGGLYNAFTMESQIEAWKVLDSWGAAFSEELGEGSALGDAMGDTLGGYAATLEQFGVLSAWLAVAASLICLFGAIKMWGLSKQGFYIYVVGQIIGVVGVFLIMGGGMMTGPVALIFPIAFIVMYGLNLKHMN